MQKNAYKHKKIFTATHRTQKRMPESVVPLHASFEKYRLRTLAVHTLKKQ